MTLPHAKSAQLPRRYSTAALPDLCTTFTCTSRLFAVSLHQPSVSLSLFARQRGGRARSQSCVSRDSAPDVPVGVTVSPDERTRRLVYLACAIRGLRWLLVHLEEISQHQNCHSYNWKIKFNTPLVYAGPSSEHGRQRRTRHQRSDRGIIALYRFRVKARFRKGLRLTAVKVKRCAMQLGWLCATPRSPRAV